MCFVKGSVESVLARCQHYQVCNPSARVEPILVADRQRFLSMEEQLASHGLRGACTTKRVFNMRESPYRYGGRALARVASSVIFSDSRVIFNDSRVILQLASAFPLYRIPSIHGCFLQVLEIRKLVQHSLILHANFPFFSLPS